MLNYYRVCFCFFWRQERHENFVPRAQPAQHPNDTFVKRRAWYVFAGFIYLDMDVTLQVTVGLVLKNAGRDHFSLFNVKNVPTSISHPFFYATFWLFVSR